MKKILSIILVLILSLSMFAACGDTNSEKSQRPKENPAKSTIRMKLYWFNDGSEGDVMTNILEEYKQETGVEIEIVFLNQDVYESKIQTLIRGGEVPALMRVTESNIEKFSDYLLSLDSKFSTNDYTNIYKNKNGKAIALPMDLSTNGMYLNKDLCDKYGVNYPKSKNESWTWVEFREEMLKLKGKYDVAYPGVFDNNIYGYVPIIYQNEGKIWNKPYTDAAINDEKSVEALTMYQNMQNKEGLIDPAVWAETKKPSELFRSGKYGFHMSGSWLFSNYQKLSFNVIVVPMPTGESGTHAAILSGNHLVALEGSGNEEASKDFIEWFAQSKNHDKYTSSVPLLSPRLAADYNFGEFNESFQVFQYEISKTPKWAVEDFITQNKIAGMSTHMNKAIKEVMGGDDPQIKMDQLAKDLIKLAKEQGLN